MGMLTQILQMYLMFQAIRWLMGSSAPKADEAAKKVEPMITERSALVDMTVYLAESSAYERGVQMRDWSNFTAIWHERAIPLIPEKPLFKDLMIDVPFEVRQNGTYVMVVKWEDPLASEWVSEWVDVLPLTLHRRVRKQKETGNLLRMTREDSEAMAKQHREVEKEPMVVVNFWKPNVTISMVDEFRPLDLQSSGHYEQLFRHWVEPAGRLVDTAGRKKYLPLTYMNDFWLLESDQMEVNATTARLPLHLKYERISPMVVFLQKSMERGFQDQVKAGVAVAGNLDDVKRIFTESNPYYLGVTMAVSILHTVFDVLAFRSDIGFWSQNKSMEGLSARTVVINAFMQVIIFLYLLDNDTSMLVLFSSGLGLLIELWKVTKVFLVSLERNPGGLIPFKITFKDRDTYVHSKTKQYDKEAMNNLSWVMFPILVGYAVYDLFTGQSHTSWYSWALSTLVSAVYMFGFILMCPQLYLNYKLKSVAHLPWRQMTYKFLNTIIDDLFAFVIKMPTMHRLAVFRDDLIFPILLYQRWIYPVDKTRVNEFGYSEVAPEGGAEGTQRHADGAGWSQGRPQRATVPVEDVDETSSDDDSDDDSDGVSGDEDGEEGAEREGSGGEAKKQK